MRVKLSLFNSSPNTSVKKILIVQTGFIGDVILSSPLISALREMYPEGEISLLTTPLASDLYRNLDGLQEVLVFDKRKSQKGLFGLFRMASELRSKSYDVVYSLHKSSRTSLLLFLSGIKERYSFKESKFSFLYSKVVPRKDLDHDVLRNLAILRVHDVEPESCATPMVLGSSEVAVRGAEELLQDLQVKEFVVIAPGSVWATKRLPVETFLEVAKSCLGSGRGVVFVGGPDDIKLGEFLAEGIEATEGISKNYINAIAKCRLSVSAEIIRKSALVVSNDSSPLHMASATNTPVVAVFCATVPEQGFGPWMVPHRIIEVKDLYCRPCGRHGSNTCPTGTHACQNQIKSGAIFLAIEELLKGG